MNFKCLNVNTMLLKIKKIDFFYRKTQKSLMPMQYILAQFVIAFFVSRIPPFWLPGSRCPLTSSSLGSRWSLCRWCRWVLNTKMSTSSTIGQRRGEIPYPVNCRRYAQECQLVWTMCEKNMGTSPFLTTCRNDTHFLAIIKSHSD